MTKSSIIADYINPDRVNQIAMVMGLAKSFGEISAKLAARTLTEAGMSLRDGFNLLFFLKLTALVLNVNRQQVIEALIDNDFSKEEAYLSTYLWEKSLSRSQKFEEQAKTTIERGCELTDVNFNWGVAETICEESTWIDEMFVGLEKAGLDMAYIEALQAETAHTPLEMFPPTLTIPAEVIRVTSVMNSPGNSRSFSGSIGKEKPRALISRTCFFREYPDSLGCLINNSTKCCEFEDNRSELRNPLCRIKEGKVIRKESCLVRQTLALK